MMGQIGIDILKDINEYNEFSEKDEAQAESLRKLEECVMESNSEEYENCLELKPERNNKMLIDQEKRDEYQMELNKYVDCLEEYVPSDCEYDKDILRENLKVPDSFLAKMMAIFDMDIINDYTLTLVAAFVIGFILKKLNINKIMNITGLILMIGSIGVFLYHLYY